MSTPLLQLHHYLGIRQQPLHRVLIYAPTIIWVEQGHKQLWWQEKRLAFDQASWLLIPAGHQLTFVNQPEQGKFRSRALTLLTPPPVEWLSAAQAGPLREPRLTVSPALAFCFELVCSMADRRLNEATQVQLLQGFYAELQAAGGLDLLFPAHTMTLGERLARYLGVEPGADHTLEGVAPHFAMSRASMARKLAAEGRSFRQLLTQVRMSHALTLLQQGLAPLETALACGYDSPSRFAARFKQEFGLTPYQYLRTCPSSLSLATVRQVNSY
ncbi:TPA: helix-turn-helix transcriptional regulator [Aeromonas hydrophila]|uniref:helix-turn-helix transcriptional regulator n=1 Tax=Aeromonas hydrophila TaxID=644 RepID=UPI000C327349|nr:helix-turn-helix transcriptional regulator [Aeromonas hydrophila]PKD23631.1 AraC family transcriptional regulator [Aeromonas hydrophila]WRK92695.1 helix-turn-helix transcriptional regulator [Aeromonas hydrophila]HAT2711840.1 helix-turn-helix transcriptional regulator [Aeromonas hydrophila]HDU8490783.1 helix-turn-helix transcriptional regulator [Aeromonas hydrophila]